MANEPKFTPEQSTLFFHVYRLPDKRSDGYCFNGGNPIPFINVDWFGGGLITKREQLIEFISQKQYARHGEALLVLANDPAWTFSFVVAK